MLQNRWGSLIGDFKPMFRFFWLIEITDNLTNCFIVSAFKNNGQAQVALLVIKQFVMVVLLFWWQPYHSAFKLGVKMLTNFFKLCNCIIMLVFSSEILSEKSEELMAWVGILLHTGQQRRCSLVAPKAQSITSDTGNGLVQSDGCGRRGCHRCNGS